MDVQPGDKSHNTTEVSQLLSSDATSRIRHRVGGMGPGVRRGVGGDFLY